jgi:hypothetical protein
MKRFIAIILVLITIVVAVSVGSVEAGGRGGGGRGGWHGGHGGHGGHGHFHGGRVFVGVGPFWPYWGYGPYWGGYPYPYYYPYAYPYATPSVVVQDPPVYVQQAPGSTAMWYYCPSAKGYYPSVPSCPDSWVPVPPHSN